MRSILPFLFLISFFTGKSESFYIKNYAVHIDLHADGSMEVHEILDIFFTEKRRGIIRKIPLRYKANNKNHRIKISDVAVDNYKSKASRDKGFLNIKIGDSRTYIEGDHTYAITYKVDRGVIPFEKSTDFYWDFIGHEWDVPIEKFNYTIDLPSNVILTKEDVKSYLGYQNSTEKITNITIDNHQVKASSHRALNPKEGATCAIGFAKETFTLNAESNNPKFSLGKDRTFPIPLALIGIFLWLWNKFDRKKSIPLTNEKIFYPPSQMSSAEVGTYIDNAFNKSDMVSLIPYWANQKLIQMKKQGDDILVVKMEHMPHDAPEYQKTLFNSIFQDQDELTLQSAGTKLRSKSVKAMSQIKSQIKDKEVYDPISKEYFHSWKSGVISFLLFGAGILSIAVFQFILTGIGFIIAAIALFVVIFLEPKKNEHGQQIHNDLVNFKETIQHLSDEDMSDLNQKDKDYFEKIFPYAVALGIDKAWANRFVEHKSYAPVWYDTYSDPRTPYKTFTDTAIVEKIDSAFSSSGSGSWNGGFGGGGFSGGGMGGGGGSSW